MVECTVCTTQQLVGALVAPQVAYGQSAAYPDEQNWLSRQVSEPEDTAEPKENFNNSPKDWMKKRLNTPLKSTPTGAKFSSTASSQRHLPTYIRTDKRSKKWTCSNTWAPHKPKTEHQ